MLTLRNAALGAVAGLAATMVMTTTMRRLHDAVADDPSGHRSHPEPYPVASPPAGEHGSGLVPHFAFGAMMGALYACLPGRRPPGLVFGPVVWAISHFGRISPPGVLKATDSGPVTYNAILIIAHALWGKALGINLRELESVTDPEGLNSDEARAQEARSHDD